MNRWAGGDMSVSSSSSRNKEVDTLYEFFFLPEEKLAHTLTLSFVLYLPTLVLLELRKVHNAQEWNELHHLLIMESLGGNSLWSDRFLGYHVAIIYYWFLNLVFLGSPRIAYQFMELLEAHAVDTYATFARTNRERLSELPPPSGK
jgi:hypothetical protein